jgi:DNA-directed RNA polymerase specialized sigma24 family protein
MSAAPQLPWIWGAGCAERAPQADTPGWDELAPLLLEDDEPEEDASRGPSVSLAFYRRHTESTLRRYLYASMQVGRTPSVLGDPVGRGWASSRNIRTFEDALVFVLDVERCLNQLGNLDRQLLSRIVLQEYTQAETAALLGMAIRTVSYKLCQALDRLTEKLVENNLLVISDR